MSLDGYELWEPEPGPEPHGGEVTNGTGWKSFVLATAGTSSILAVLITLWLLWKHLTHWNYPRHQAYIVRILLMCPIYAVDSWLSLFFLHYSIYFDLIRDCYEAYVLYQFFALLVMYVEDGDPDERDCNEILHDKKKMKHPIPCCCLPRYQPGPVFMIYEYRCILQYVILKPLCALIACILQPFDLYQAGNFSPKYGYLYICITTNVSVSLALYCLLLFYITAHTELEPFKPFPKVLAIKAILFFAFWQYVAIGVLAYFDAIPAIDPWNADEVAEGLNNYIICFEMLILAILHHFVFPGDEYKDFEPDEEPKGPKPKGMKKLKKAAKRFVSDVVDQSDMVDDVKNNMTRNKMKKAKAKQRSMRREKKAAGAAAYEDIDDDELISLEHEDTSLAKSSKAVSGYGATETRGSGSRRGSTSKGSSKSSDRNYQNP